MLERVTIKPVGGGVNKDTPPNELAANEWSDSLNMRFANGIAERRGGTRAAWTTPLITPYAIEPFITSSGTRFVVYAGLTKVYVDDGSVQTEITRKTDGKAITSITNATTTATLTTATAHGLSNGNTVTVFGASPSAYNGTFVITVTGATTFTYTMLSDPGGSATTVGQYHGSSISNFTGNIDDKWTLFVFNGILIANNPVDGPYYWNGDVTTPLRRLPGWAAGDKAYSMGAFKNYIIALAPTLSGTFKPHHVMWSNSAEAGAIPTTWTASDTNDAGDTKQTAEVGGYLIEGRTLGDEFILYKDDGRFSLQFIGGNAVFALRRIQGKDGLRARHCVMETPKGHVFLSNGDVRLEDGRGSISIAEGRIRRWLIAHIDGSNASRSFLALNPSRCEVWIVFPEQDQTVPNKAAVWNWDSNTWAIFSVPPATCAGTGLIATGVDSEAWEDDPDPWLSDMTDWYEYEFSPNEQRLILGLTGPYLGLADTGISDLGTAVSWQLEKLATTLEDNDSLKVISRIRPQASASPNAVFSITCASTMEASDDVVYEDAIEYTVGTTNWGDIFSEAGRFLAIKLFGSDDAIIAFRSFDLELDRRRGRF